MVRQDSLHGDLLPIPRRRGYFPHARRAGGDNRGMREPEWSAKRLKGEIEALGARGLPRGEYFAELAPRLRRAVANDASCWHTLDPQTRLLTSDEPREMIERGIYR